MVHVERRRANKTDTTVYGITTDAQSFFFLKIDDNSQVSTISNLNRTMILTL